MSEKILIIGKNSKISKELLKKIPKNKTVIQPSKYVWNMEDINFDKIKIFFILKSNIQSSRISFNFFTVIKV